MAHARELPVPMSQLMLLGADRSIFRSRKRRLFYDEIGGEVGEVSIRGATHDDAQHPNIALAITGTAESNDEEDGVVCFACAAVVENKLATLSETVRFEGSRNEVRSRAAHHAIDRLPRYYAQLRSS